MKLRLLLFLLLFSMPLHAFYFFSLDVGPTLQYTRYHQGCLPSQAGFMTGPALDMYIYKAWRPMGYIGFKGLWDFPHICSENGLIINSNEYEVNAHLGFCFETKKGNLSFIPFTGIDFIYLSHEITTDILEHRYFQVNVPIGVYFRHYVSKIFEWGIKSYYDIDVWTRLNVSSPCLCDCDNIKLRQSHRFHIEAPLKLFYLVDKPVSVDLGLIPLFTWQKFAEEECCDRPLNIPVLKQWHLGMTITIGINF